MDDKFKKERSTMSIMVDIINEAHALFKLLDEASWLEKKFSPDLCLEFERMSWEVLRLKNNISNIRDNL